MQKTPEASADDEFFDILRVSPPRRQGPLYHEADPACWSSHSSAAKLADKFDAWRRSVRMPVDETEGTEQKIKRMCKRKWSASFGEFVIPTTTEGVPMKRRVLWE